MAQKPRQSPQSPPTGTSARARAFRTVGCDREAPRDAGAKLTNSTDAEGSEETFLKRGGEAAALIRILNWSATPLGPLSDWPQSLKTATGLLLGSPVPIVMLWGPEGVMIYNDAYSVFAGGRHPELLGSNVREGWPEVADFNDNVMKVGLAGGTLAYKDQELTLYRHGRPEQVWMNLDYSPVLDESGEPAGVIAIVVETTETVLAERSKADLIARQRRQFEQAPGFIIVMDGPEHVVDFVNATHRRVFGSDDWTGKTIRAAFPSIAGQGFYEVLDEVYRSGQAHQFDAVPVRFRRAPEAREELHYLTFIYAPVFGDNGSVSGIFCDGFDVTERTSAELRLKALVQLTDRLRGLENLADISYAAGEILGESLGVSRVGYGTVDARDDSFAVERDWNAPGVASIAGVLNLRDFGSFVDDLKAGRLVAIGDVRLDPRTAPAASALEQRNARSFVNVPVVEGDLTVAVLYINHAETRDWVDEDLAFIREYAARVRTAIERARATRALRASEAGLRELNEHLERRVAAALAERKLLADIVETTDAFIQVVDLDFNFLAINRASAQEFERIFGVPVRAGDNMLELLADKPEHLAAVKAIWARALAGAEFSSIDEFGDAALDRRYYEMKFNVLRNAKGERIGAYQFVYDVTARLRDQNLLAQTQEALRQSQKMEAVGQLTGGIAHDFNNLLAAIIGSLSLIERRLADGKSGIDRYIGAGRDAANRAAALTQRLLAFSRRQTLDPKPTDANKLIGGMEDLIRGTMGPNVEVEVVGAAGLWVTRVDRSQLENSLLNLCINARDAMAPSGGRVTIETANKWMDQRGAKERDLKPGQYVSVCVTDTGTGMTPEVMERAFDPFFTTKPLGQGTGLGLSMIYGFVRQSGGQVRIYSEVGKGTTMCLYLPRFTGELEDDSSTDAMTASEVGAGETVLVIDDEAGLRMLMTDVLVDAGYNVLTAADGPSGMTILRSASRIDVLVTDVGLPGGMNGRQVADAARVLRPDLPVLFITGYAENAAIGNGHLEHGMEVLTKPFEVAALAARVRDMIDK